MSNPNDDRPHPEMFPRKLRRRVEMALFLTCEGLKEDGVSQDVIYQVLFEQALAEANDGPAFDPFGSESFLRNVRRMKEKIDPMVAEIDATRNDKDESI